MQMTKTISAGASALAILPALAISLTGTLHVPGAVEQNVGSGAVTETRLVAPGENPVVKTGEGTWVVPDANVDQKAPLSVIVKEGKVAFAAGAEDLPAPKELSARILGKLAFWGSAKDANPEHFTEVGGKLTKWYDVRETNVTTPTYLHLETYEEAYAPMRKTFEDEAILGQTNFYPAVYFGGFGSGQRLVFKTPAGKETTDYMPFRVAVQGTPDKTVGSLFGSCHPTVGWKFSYLAAALSSGANPPTYLVDQDYPPVASGSAWLDGVRIDAQKTAVRRGMHIFAAQAGTVTGGLGGGYHALYSRLAEDRNSAGGDYLGEVMYFSDPLNESERLEVDNYLSRKWFGKSVAEKRVTLASGTQLEISAETGETVSGLNLRAEGRGTVAMTGRGTVEYRPDDAAVADPAELDVGDGRVALKRQAPLKVSAGDSITVSSEQFGDDVATQAKTAGSGALVKQGKGRALVTSVPSDASKVRIEAGQLIVGSSHAGEAKGLDTFGEVFIPNHSFEEWDEADRAKSDVDLADKGKNAAYHGWMSTTGGSCAWYDVEAFKRGTPVGDWDLNTYKLAEQRPTDGNCAMLFKSVGASAAVEVTIPEPGVYRFSCAVAGRANYNTIGSGVAVQLVRDSAVIADLGVFRDVSDRCFTPCATETEIPEAGTYRLVLSLYRTPKVSASTWRDLTVAVDDLHLRKVASLDGRRWRLPNGDFEHETFVGSYYDGVSKKVLTTDYDAFVNDNTAAGWTLSRQGGATASIVAPFTKLGDAGDCFVSRRDGLSSGAELCFVGEGATATVAALKPPAGTWYLDANVATRYAAVGELKATVTGGGKTFELGTVSTDAKKLMSRVWPESFVADGTSEYSLTLTCLTPVGEHNEGVVADDFAFVDEYADDRELVTNGSFESYASNVATGWRYIYPSGSGWTTVRQYDTTPSTVYYYGPDFGKGSMCIELSRANGISQTVAIPKAGWYRLSFLAKARQTNTPAVPNPTDVDLLKGDKTIHVTQVDEVGLGRFKHHTYAFKVDEPGEWTLRFQGTREDLVYMYLDDVSLKYAGTGLNDTPAFASNAVIDVAEGARIRLEFSGTNEIRKVRYAGKPLFGVVNAATHPEFVSGDGILYSEQVGNAVILQ